ncbi:Domain unknown function DUF295 [Dillenia turbinata]|uniref:KIB1-4 beta-propeller domain-containing protein n=1 Tax=Dillenia turbinata TaxID=194707 RepID=A0AAN8VDS1_9MAGN
MADWSGLLPELLMEISKKIDLIHDFVNFGCVCKPWLRAASAAKFNTKCRLPLLMLAEKEKTHVREFYDISMGGQIHQLDLPVAPGSSIFPTLGWLVVVLETNADMIMLHPFSRRIINLPNPISLTEELVENGITWLPHFLKAVLSADPCLSSDWILMIIYDGIGKLAFVKNGDKAWTGIDAPISSCSDIYYYERRFYGVDYQGRIAVCDVHGPNPTAGLLISRIPTSLNALVGCKFYLAEWCEKLVVIHRSLPKFKKVFRVFEIDFTHKGNWVEVSHLGSKAIFLGHNSSITVDASEFRRCKRNCIYFTDDSLEGYVDSEDGRDMGIYNMANRSVEPHFEEESCPQIIPRWLEPHFDGMTCAPLIPSWVQLNF